MMNKENKSAGLRRSAIAERIRLREEWSALKETADAPAPSAPTRVLAKRDQSKNMPDKKQTIAKEQAKPRQVTSDVLRGVVALVEVASEPRALPLRAALAALGATVVPSWSPLVTHLVWTQGGCRSTRAKARALACRLVSPLWVEACAAAARHLPERTFPAAARASDLPSPRTLRRLLIRAEIENIPLADLLCDSMEEDREMKKLRLSTDTETDTSHDKSADTSHDKSHDTTDAASRVNTAPRRMLPVSMTPPPTRKSRRKLFTQREAQEIESADDSREEAPVVPKRPQLEQKSMVRAKRLVKRLLAACSPAKPKPNTVALNAPRIVLTGMSRSERRAAREAIHALNGRLQARVNKRTTHVLLGSCREDPDCYVTGVSDINNPSCVTGVTNINRTISTCATNQMNATPSATCDLKKARTLSALAGAARGCRVLRARWAANSAAAGAWLHHHGYEVPHLRKLQQKACVERKALGRMRSEYAYDVFGGMRVRLGANVEKEEAVVQLLSLCGAVVVNPRTIGDGVPTVDFDITVGTGAGEISSKWVFDSVAATRMRTTRRYTTC